jgi:hypothetical protein
MGLLFSFAFLHIAHVKVFALANSLQAHEVLLSFHIDALC